MPETTPTEEPGTSEDFLATLGLYDEQVIGLARQNRLTPIALWRFCRDLFRRMPRLVDSAVDNLEEEENESGELTLEQVESLKQLLIAVGNAVGIAREHDAYLPDLVAVALGRLDQVARQFVSGPLSELVPDLAEAAKAVRPMRPPPPKDKGRSPAPWRDASPAEPPPPHQVETPEAVIVHETEAQAESDPATDDVVRRPR